MIPSTSNLPQGKLFSVFVWFCLWDLFVVTVGNVFYKQSKCLPGSYLHEKLSALPLT